MVMFTLGAMLFSYAAGRIHQLFKEGENERTEIASIAKALDQHRSAPIVWPDEMPAPAMVPEAPPQIPEPPVEAPEDGKRRGNWQ